jgi:hypothetical protein
MQTHTLPPRKRLAMPAHPDELLQTRPARSIVGHAWWMQPASVVADAVRNAAPTASATYKFGDGYAQIVTDHNQLLKEFEDDYHDCGAALNSASPLPVVRCVARTVPDTSLLALHFSAPSLPSIFDAALSLVRPRLDLRHYDESVSGLDGWRLIADCRNSAAPLLVASDDVVLLDTALEPPEFAVNLIVGIVQLAQSSTVFVHGGGVRVGDRGVLITGKSGAGKSTTSAALAGRGHVLLGDETVGLRPDTREIVAFNRNLKIRPGPISLSLEERLSQMHCEERLDANGTSCAWVRPSMLFAGVAVTREAPLTHVFFLGNMGAHANAERFFPSLNDLDELRALTMSLSAVVSWTLSPSRRLLRFARLTELFSMCHCYRLDLGTPDESAAVIERMVLNNEL